MTTHTIQALHLRLHNEVNNESTLFTLGQGDEGQKLRLEIENRSRGDIKIAAGSKAPTADNYHFTIVLPPGLLNAAVELEVPDGWEIATGTENHYDHVYLLWRGSGEIVVPAGGSSPLEFTLTRIKISTELAWRHTTVVLRYANLRQGNHPMPVGMLRVPLTILHAFSTDLSDLENVTSVVGLRNEVIQLRDTMVPPLQLTLDNPKRNWLAAGSKRTIHVSLRLNPHFSAIHSNEWPQMEVGRESFELFYESPVGASIDAEIYGEGDALEEMKFRHDKETNHEKVFMRAVKNGWVFRPGSEIPIKITLDTGGIGLRKLRVVCRGLIFSGKQLEDFTIELPFQVGILEEQEKTGSNGLVKGELEVNGKLKVSTVEGKYINLNGSSGGSGSAGILRIGATGNPNLRFGVVNNGKNGYSWMQSHGSLPLRINDIGNDVTIGSRLGIGGDPDRSAKLHVFGASKLEGSLGVTGSATFAQKLTAESNGLVKGELEVKGKLKVSTVEGKYINLNGSSGGSGSAGILRIGATGSPNLRFGVVNNGKNGYSWIQSHGNLPLRINELGNDVTIGSRLGIGSTYIDEEDLKILKKLVQGKLTVNIVSGHGYVLDNYFGRVNGGDGSRTVQFQKLSNPKSRTSWNMTLKPV